MEASLLDMTRGFDHVVPIHPLGDYHEVVVEYVFEHAAVEDAFAEPWFAVHDEAPTAEDLPFPSITTPRSLHAVLGFAAAIALAAGLYGATL